MGGLKRDGGGVNGVVKRGARDGGGLGGEKGGDTGQDVEYEKDDLLVI